MNKDKCLSDDKILFDFHNRNGILDFGKFMNKEFGFEDNDVVTIDEKLIKKIGIKIKEFNKLSREVYLEDNYIVKIKPTKFQKFKNKIKKTFPLLQSKARD